MQSAAVETRKHGRRPSRRLLSRAGLSRFCGCSGDDTMVVQQPSTATSLTPPGPAEPRLDQPVLAMLDGACNTAKGRFGSPSGRPPYTATGTAKTPCSRRRCLTLADGLNRDATPLPAAPDLLLIRRSQVRILPGAPMSPQLRLPSALPERERTVTVQPFTRRGASWQRPPPYVRSPAG